MAAATQAPLRVAMLGAGYFSQFHERAWKRLPEVALVGVCDRAPGRADAVASAHGGRAFDDLETMLETVRPHLLDIVTPPASHLGAIAAAAARGIGVVCQKPFCNDLAGAERAVATAAAAGIDLVVHENFRFQPWHREIAKLVRDGRLGRVWQAAFRLRPGDGQGERAYLDRQPYFQAMPRFLVHETVIHLVDVFRALLGEVAGVSAVLRRLNPVIAGEDAGVIVLEMAGGAQALIDANRLSDHRAANRRLTMGEMLVEGEKGVLSLDGDGRIGFRAHGSNDGAEVAYAWRDHDFGGDCVYALQRHVVDAKLGRGAYVNSGREYLANIRVEEAIYASSREGRRVAIPPAA